MLVTLRAGYEKPVHSITPDIRVIIDVFRASTTTLAILEGEAASLFIANDFELIKKYSEEGYLVVSEVFDLGLDNSPTLVKKLGVKGCKVILKTSNLTTALEENSSGEIVIGCFNNLAVLFQLLNDSRYQNIEIVPAGYMSHMQMNIEDMHCAQILRESLETKQLVIPNEKVLASRIEGIRNSKPLPEHYIDDLYLAIKPNISQSVPRVAAKNNLFFELSL